jgi:hypothetical protein
LSGKLFAESFAGTGNGGEFFHNGSGVRIQESEL